MTRAQQTKSRRMGIPGSANWHAMLDGAECVLREEGYAALTSRNTSASSNAWFITISRPWTI